MGRGNSAGEHLASRAAERQYLICAARQTITEGGNKLRRWHILLASGLVGVASLFLAPFEQLVPDQDLSPQLRALILIQPAILTIAAVALGQALAGKVGLGAPLVDAWLRNERPGEVLRRQLPSALLLGLAAAVILVVYSSVILPRVADPAMLERMASFSVPLPTRILYGGITEELLTRWGLVSLIVWAISRMGGRGERPAAAGYWIAITLAAALFAIGHIPMLLGLSIQPSAGLVVAVLLANSVPGIMFGWLFWRRGIEAAMIAHALAHIASTLAQL